MPPKFDPHKHHRHSIRLPGYDYTMPGGYYLTIVTHDRACLFGEVVHGEMQLSEYGRIANECWQAIPIHFPHVELDIYVIMPNHVHGIIILHDDSRGTIYRAPTPTTEQFGAPVAGSIPTIVRTYKAAVSRRIGKELNGAVAWQKNYYEHILRADDDYHRIHAYIENNPLEWDNDIENPANSTPKD